MSLESQGTLTLFVGAHATAESETHDRLEVQKSIYSWSVSHSFFGKFRTDRLWLLGSLSLEQGPDGTAWIQGTRGTASFHVLQSEVIWGGCAVGAHNGRRVPGGNPQPGLLVAPPQIFGTPYPMSCPSLKLLTPLVASGPHQKGHPKRA